MDKDDIGAKMFIQGWKACRKYYFSENSNVMFDMIERIEDIDEFKEYVKTQTDGR